MGASTHKQPSSLVTRSRSRIQRPKSPLSLHKAGIDAIGICGVGLIGGSIAERLKQLKEQPQVFGHDKSVVIAQALKERVISARLTPEDMLQRCDVIILSANPATNQSFLRRLSKRKTDTQALIIDTSSTQTGIAELNRALKWKNEAQFIAGHPMAGREVQGLANRQSFLFEDHPFFFDDSVKLGKTERNLLEAFVASLGSYAMYVDNNRHDSVMTDISQLPQVLSTVMSAFVSNYNRQTIHLAGTGLQSMIRLGGSPYGNWRDVFAENNERLCQRLDALIEELQNTRDTISSGGSLREHFQKARRSYSCLW